MSGNTFGTLFKVTTFGESHGDALGCVIDGCPAGIKLDLDRIQKELDRRRPGQKAPSADKAAAANAAVTSRSEADRAEIVSGLFEGVTTGTPIAIIIRNTSQHSADYSNIKDMYRPGHADYTYDAKYGRRDYRGGGRSSGRETAARVAAGAVARQVLEALVPFSITAFTTEAAGIECNEFNLDCIEENSMRACDNKAATLMEEKIASLRAEGDSAGGVVECLIRGVPAGLGEPVFDKLDAELAKAMLSIGAIKGIEFGSGFAVARMKGSECNDAMRPAALKADEALSASPAFVTNNAGGILGGISNGNDIIFRVAVKPVPSIAKEQQTVTRNGKAADMKITGRHDVCLCPRIVPVVEAMAAITLCDMLLRQLAVQFL
ncbi:MAG: chorismate synthase [Treponema sp.]|nr:chorismate synthase [Candidatus Treponema caballi]